MPLLPVHVHLGLIGLLVPTLVFAQLLSDAELAAKYETLSDAELAEATIRLNGGDCAMLSALCTRPKEREQQ